MRRRLVIVGTCMLLVALLLMTRSALGPRWTSDMNHIRYAAYSDGRQLVLCARGMTGNALLNALDRVGVLRITDNDRSECVYFEFAATPRAGTYALNGTGRFVVSGRGETHPFSFHSPSALTTMWLERTCFCKDADVSAPFDGELIIESMSPPRGRLQLTVREPRGDIAIDARLTSFAWESVAELRHREGFQRLLTR